MELEIVKYFNQLGLGVIDPATRLVSYIPNLIFLWAALAVFVFFRDKINGRRVFLSIILALVFHFIFSEWFFKDFLGNFSELRLRPWVASPSQIFPLGELLTDSSFPSGHMSSTLAVLTIIFIYYRRFWPVSAFFILFMAYSRMHNGMHYPTDVLVGAVLGIAYGLSSYSIVKKFFNWIFESKNKDKARKGRQKKKKRKLPLIAGSACIFLAFMITGMRIFYPFHVFFGLAFLAVSFYLFWWGTMHHGKKLKEIKKFIKIQNFFLKYEKLFIFGLVVIFISLTLLILFPQKDNPFSSLSSEELKRFIQNDQEVSLAVMDNLEISATKLVDNKIFAKNKIDPDEREEILKDWNDFLSASKEADKMIEVHKYFHKILFLKYPAENAQSFMIAYSLYIKKNEVLHRLMGAVKGRDYFEKILNENNSNFQKDNIYREISADFFRPETAVKINSGKAYLLFLDTAGRDKNFSESYQILKNKAQDSYRYLFNNLNLTAVEGIKTGEAYLEKQMLGIWFPVQKNTAYVMGETYVSRRHEKLISLDQISEMKNNLEPGDILVERRNWYASNIGIPGFWPHAALYMGSLDQMREYFKGQFPFGGYSNLDEYLREKHLALYEKYSKKDPNNYDYSIIEGKSPGVIISPVEESARADYVGVMRPLLSKEDKLKSIFRAFENYQKPYDYDFDFETRDKLVCSELVYDAYLETGGKSGIKFNLEEMLGRKIMSPTDMVKKYYDERNTEKRELDFVYFIDGNEKLKKALVKGEEEFLTTWTRPKYDIAQE
jgi:membrane-associated phospholipid phosphatase